MTMKYGLMHAKAADASVLDRQDFIFEPKLDGYRALCICEKGKPPAFYSRNGRKFDFALDFKINSDCVLDGEIVAYGEKGIPDFNLLQNREGNPVYVAFDILRKGGKDISQLPLIERKKILAKTINGPERQNLKLQFYTKKGRELFAQIRKRGLEGIMAKKEDSPYAYGRSYDWLKLKLFKTVDCVILGFEEGKKSLHLGLYDHGTLTFVGKVGSGFSEETIARLRNLLAKRKTLVCEVKYAGFKDRLRAPVFIRLREDKSPEECTLDQLEEPSKLGDYQKRREFGKTPEPGTEEKRTGKKNPIFVVQRHDARRLHFDFRLEESGVLKSWAVPNGLPSESEKKLAVQVEDHPLGYADFQGVIPEGNYGAGMVKIWDRGIFANITIKKGKVKPLGEAIADGHFLIWLKGKRTEGGYALTRMEGKNWIMVKMKEGAAERKKYPPYLEIGGKKVELTNPEKELDSGITKGDLVVYYSKAAKLMLPHVKGRIITMYRFPEGVREKGFYHKSRPDYFPDWIPGTQVDVEGKKETYAVCDSEAAIVFLANYACVIHPWTSRADKPDYPDRIIFDLDPAGKDLEQLRKIALRLKNFLEKIGFTPYIMTTGGKGFHVSIPIKRDSTFSEVRIFAGKIAKVFANGTPGVTAEPGLSGREGKVYMDVNRNSKGQTAVAPYSARPTPGFPVARPFDWKELSETNPQSYNIFSPIRGNPWKDFFKHAVSVKEIVNKLKRKRT